MRFIQEHPILCANVVFLAAGAGAAFVGELAYRIACVVIVLTLRAVWAQTALQQAMQSARKETLNEIDDRRGKH